MAPRIQDAFQRASTALPNPGSALRETFRAGYGRADLRADLLAGLVVGIVALPLSMALAIASGVAPQHGLYTAIIAGASIALLGGSPVQVSGPTAAFVVVLAPIAARYGLGGLLLATFLAGVLLFVMGLARLGQLIAFIPYPVTTGFTAGIGVVIATLQLRDLLGLTVTHMPEHFLERLLALVHALPTARVADLAVGVLTLAVLLLLPRVTRRVPAPLVALVVGALAAVVIARLAPDYRVATINSRFSYMHDGVVHQGIPALPPHWVWPWALPGPDGTPIGLSLQLLRTLALPAFAIAMLGGIESLLSAVIADGMIGKQHDPDAELLAQGTGNIIAPFFGGIAATGAIARTATNIRAGARSPFAAVVHSGVLLLATLFLAGALGHLPMASLGALLLLVAWNMAEVRHFLHTVRVAPRSDVIVLLSCFFLTVVFDMVVAVTAGVLLAALLFMRRMAEVSGMRLVGPDHPALDQPLPPGVLLYEVAGPLFFGAAQKAMSALNATHLGVKPGAAGVRVVVIDLEAVPAIDATGVVNLESALERLYKQHIQVVLAGLQPQPTEALERAGVVERPGRLSITPTFATGIERARILAAPLHPAAT